MKIGYNKNHNIPAYIDAAMRLYLNGEAGGVAPSNNDFIKVVDFLRKRSQ